MTIRNAAHLHGSASAAPSPPTRQQEALFFGSPLPYNTSQFLRTHLPLHYSGVPTVFGWILCKDSGNRFWPAGYEIRRLLEVAEQEAVTVQLVSPEQFDLLVACEGSHSLLLDGQPVELPHFLLPRMGAATTYFALAVIRHLERLGVHAINSAHSIETVRDKLYTQQILSEYRLPVPKTMLVKFPVDIHLVEKQLGIPVVVKTLSGSQGNGVFLCESRSRFRDLMALIEQTNPHANMILQEFIASSRGRDLRVLTIGGRLVGCVQRLAPEGEFKANYSAGGRVEPFTPTAEIEWLATETSRILGLEVAGIDLLFADDHYKVCEANSSPGFEGLESCCPVNVAREIYQFIRIRQGIFE